MTVPTTLLPMTEGEMVLAVLGLMVISAVTRSTFFLSCEPWKLPAWAERGLKYAPLAALAAVVAPEVLMSQGHLVKTWQDARLVAAPVAIAWAVWRKDMLTTIGVGMAVYLLLKLGLGWA
ncbi:AzlD domain-containing protein [Aquabacterium sp.]|uniref:AzlD domain-containing protein n=1 Tax=Aquabacterium sp. TaxID=1872578 RepID=UPI0025BEA969|nr:AzlD domain-containing protein [Aquabacterium sp.]